MTSSIIPFSSLSYFTIIFSSSSDYYISTIIPKSYDIAVHKSFSYRRKLNTVALTLYFPPWLLL